MESVGPALCTQNCLSEGQLIIMPMDYLELLCDCCQPSAWLSKRGVECNGLSSNNIVLLIICASQLILECSFLSCAIPQPRVLLCSHLC